MATGQNLSFIPKYEFKCVDFDHTKKDEMVNILNELGQQGWYIVDIIRERHIVLSRWAGQFSWENVEE